MPIIPLYLPGTPVPDTVSQIVSVSTPDETDTVYISEDREEE